MRKHNDGTDESNVLQNQFTAFLVTAIRNRKIQLLRSIALLRYYETILEIQDCHFPIPDEADLMLGLPFWEQLENATLRQSLKRIKERDLYIFLAKVLEDRSLAEIASSLGISYNTTASIYYRIVDRLKKELGGDGR